MEELKEYDPLANDPLRRWWQGTSKQYKIWLFSSVLWVLLTASLMVLVDPWSIFSDALSEINTGQGEGVGLLFFITAIPPIFSGAAYFGYRALVK